jgi:hypothetical protein
VTKLILACDPGITGAFALFTSAGELLHAADIPIIRDQKTAWVDADALSSALMQLIQGQPTTAVVERVHAMPKNGCVAAFSQGATLASLLATLQIVRARIEFVNPGVWKRQLGFQPSKGTSDRERKAASLDKARLLYPTAPLDRQKDHNRAEAILLGAWYLQNRVIAKAA